MKLAILYSPNLPIEEMLKKGKKYFDKVLVLPIYNLRYVFGEESKLMYKDTDICDFDAVYMRIHDFDLLFIEQIIEVLKDHDVYVQMDSDSGLVASNKFYTVERLRESNVPVPDSIYANSPEIAMEAVKKLGYPVAIKLLSSYGGKGVMRASSEEELKPLMDTLELLEQSICLEDFINDVKENIRVMVIGDKAYSLKFVSEEGEWRASPGVGGKKEKFDAPEEIKDLAVKGAKAVGFDLCDFDFVTTEDGKAYVVEIDLIEVTDDEACELVGVDLREEIMSLIHSRVLEKQANV